MASTIKTFAKQVPGLPSIYDWFFTSKLGKRLRIIHRNYPQTINIELTTRCNSLCIYCPRQKLVSEGTRQVKDMDFELVKKIVQDIKNSKRLPGKIVLGGLGETMLYKDFAKVVRFIRSQLPQVRLGAGVNGIYFPREIQHVLIATNFGGLTISVNSPSRELYRQYNGVDKFESVIANTESFLKLKGNRKPNTIVQILDIYDNQEYLHKFHEFWRQRINSNDHIYVRPVGSFGGLIGAKKFTDIDRHQQYPCAQIFRQLTVNVNGDCFPCCVGVVTLAENPLCIGNIQRETINDIFLPDSQVQWVRKIHKRGDLEKIPVCKRCQPWSRGPNLFFKIAGRWV